MREVGCTKNWWGAKATISNIFFQIRVLPHVRLPQKTGSHEKILAGWGKRNPTTRHVELHKFHPRPVIKGTDLFFYILLLTYFLWLKISANAVRYIGPYLFETIIWKYCSVSNDIFKISIVWVRISTSGILTGYLFFTYFFLFYNVLIFWILFF